MRARVIGQRMPSGTATAYVLVGPAPKRGPASALHGGAPVLRQVGHTGRVIEVSEERFYQLVATAFEEIPAELTDLLDNVALFVEDDAPADDPHLLGLYEGVPLTERDSRYGGVLPDRILVFRRPTLAICDTEDQVVREVAITVAHEIAHHFGIDDARLHDLGYA